DDGGVRVLAPRAPDRLPRLALGLGRDGAGVEDDGIVEARGARMTAHHLGLIGVQAAAEGDDLGRHTLLRPQPSSEESRTPVKLVAKAPVISTRPSSRHSTSSIPPSRTTSARRPIRPRRAAATIAAQAPVPQARVT